MDLPKQAWPEFLKTLLNNVTSSSIPDETKIASLETLGYLCEKLDQEVSLSIYLSI
jgi:importin subunit beta-1